MSPTVRPLFIALLLVSVCAMVFSPVCRHPFVRWDDEINVYRNPYLNPAALPNITHFWTSDRMGQDTDRVYRPVVYTAYWLIAQTAAVTFYHVDGEGAGLDPRPFHTVNLLVHLLNVLLVFALLRRWVRQDWAAGLGAMLFAIHPVQVEPVAWVTGLTDLLGAFFSLLAIWEYSCFRETRARRHYALATVCFALALLSKPSAAVVPLLALVLDWGRMGRGSIHWKHWKGENLKWLASWLPLSLGMVWVTHTAEPIAAAEVATAWWTRPAIAADTLVVTLGHIFWPGHLGVDYGRSPEVVLHGGVMLWLRVFLTVMVAGLVWLGRRRFPWLLAPVLFFVLALLPVLGLVPFRFQTFSTVADRYSYLPLFGLALLLAEVAVRVPLPTIGPARRIAAAGACVSVLLLGMLTSRQVTTWRSTQAMWTQALAVNPESWMAHYNLGGLLMAHGQVDQARSQFREVVRLRPGYQPAQEALHMLTRATEPI